MIDLSHGSTNTYLVEERHNLIPPCFHCGRFEPVLLDGTEYFNRFVRGANIQEAFPTLGPAERELIMSGIHSECWDEMMVLEDD